MARHGQRPATIYDVARQAGTAVSSVSRVLNGHPNVSPALRQRVEQAMRELDYKPNPAAHSLRGGATGLIGCLVGSMANPVLAPIYTSAEQVLRTHGYSMLLANSQNEPDLDVAYLRLMARRRVDGLIVSSAAAALDRAGDVVAQLKIPTVMLDRDLPAGAHVSAVQSDHASGMRAAIQHLVSQGHRRIALIGGPSTWRPTRERLQGYLAGLQAAGIAPEPALIRNMAMSQAVGYVEMTTLLTAARPPTALIAGGNLIVAGVLRALQEHGVGVGRDLALVGCDDIDITQLYNPPITVVARDLTMLGEAAARLLIETIARAGGRVVTLPTQLVVRQSSAAGPPAEPAPTLSAATPLPLAGADPVAGSTTP